MAGKVKGMFGRHDRLETAVPDRTHLPTRRKRIIQIATTFGLLAVPVAALAWQGGALGSAGGNDQLDESDGSSAVVQPSTDSSQSDAGSSASQSVNVNTQQSSGAGGSSSQNVSVSSSSSGSGGSSVTVNGKKIHVPNSGELHKTINSDNGQTNIDISSNGDGTASNTSTLNVQINSDNQNSGDNGQ